ncbi:MAG: hypothetical protein B6I38_00145 [Anaerolineaceae bacterium 4572_5.1]|nr:MAG: hypothetical protein B6I38_00145 [Anaerolineaceae bacterium 4572_5.1]RLD07862.1 MAG: YlxR family protein [Chloroflexota bacterium]
MASKRKHQPQRTCVGCGEVQSKQTLIRVVRTPEGVQVDQTRKLSGRGAYLHPKRSCWEKGLSRTLGHALKIELTLDDKERLRTFMMSLPE